MRSSELFKIFLFDSMLLIGNFSDWDGTKKRRKIRLIFYFVCCCSCVFFFAETDSHTSTEWNRSMGIKTDTHITKVIRLNRERMTWFLFSFVGSLRFSCHAILTRGFFKYFYFFILIHFYCVPFHVEIENKVKQDLFFIWFFFCSIQRRWRESDVEHVVYWRSIAKVLPYFILLFRNRWFSSSNRMHQID